MISVFDALVFVVFQLAKTPATWVVVSACVLWLSVFSLLDTLFIFLVLCALGYAYPRAYLHALNRGLVFMEPRARVQEAINMRPILDALRTHVQTLELPLDKSGIVIESLALRLKVQQLVQAPVISVAYFIRERPLVFESDAVVVGCTRVLNTLSFFDNRDTVTIIVLHAPETKNVIVAIAIRWVVNFVWNALTFPILQEHCVFEKMHVL